MTHAFALVPNFSSLPSAEPVPFHADPIFAAIERHEEAYAIFQVAPDGDTAMAAQDEYNEARTALLRTFCATRPGAFCLLRHLRWWLAQEAEFASDYQPDYAAAQGREAELTLLLNCDGIDRLVRIPVALPSGRLPAPQRALPAPESIASARATATHSGRFLLIGEAIGALVLIAGGCLFTAVASLV